MPAVERQIICVELPHLEGVVATEEVLSLADVDGHRARPRHCSASFAHVVIADMNLNVLKSIDRFAHLHGRKTVTRTMKDTKSINRISLNESQSTYLYCKQLLSSKYHTTALLKCSSNYKLVVVNTSAQFNSKIIN